MSPFVSSQRVRETNFFAVFVDIKEKISNHRKKFVKKNISMKIDNLYKLIKELDDFQKEIEILKENCLIFKKDFNDYFKSEIDYIDLMRNTLIILTTNINKGINVDDIGNDLLFYASRISYCKDKMRNILIRSIDKSKCKYIDDTYIDSSQYKNYLYLLDKCREFEKKKKEIIVSLGKRERRDKVLSNTYNVLEVDKESFTTKRDELIESYEKKSGRKVRFNIDDVSVYIPRKYKHDFINAYNGLKKHYSIQDIFSLPLTRTIKDNVVCIGKINGINLRINEDLCCYENDKDKYAGSIKVDKKISDNDVVYYNGGDSHHQCKKIKGIKKPLNTKKIKKGIIKSSIAIVLSLVTAVSSYGLFKSFSNRNNNHNDDTTVNSSISAIPVYTVINDKISEVNSKSIIVNEESDEVIVSKQEIVSDKVSNDEIKYTTDDLQLNQEITIIEGSSIYDNCWSAADEVDGLNPYYSCNEKRKIDSFGLEYNGEIIYTGDNDEINRYMSLGAHKTVVCTSINGCGEGFYNIDDVVVANKTLTKSM